MSNGLIVAARLRKLLFGNSQSHVCLFNLSKDSLADSCVVVPDSSQICPALQQRRPHQFGGEAVVDGTLQHTGWTVQGELPLSCDVEDGWFLLVATPDLSFNSAFHVVQELDASVVHVAVCGRPRHRAILEDRLCHDRVVDNDFASLYLNAAHV